MYYSYPTSHQFQYNYAKWDLTFGMLQALFVEKSLSVSAVSAWVQDPV